MIALAETVRPSEPCEGSEPSQGYPDLSALPAQAGKEWNRAKAEYRESVERKVATGELKPRAVRVFYALKLRSDHNYKPVYPSLNTIAKDTGLTVKSIRQAITELVDTEIIKIGQKHSPSRPSQKFCA